jgi:uncharacterized protein YkwD
MKQMKQLILVASLAVTAIAAPPAFAGEIVAWPKEDVVERLIAEHDAFAERAAAARAFMADTKKYPPPVGTFAPGRDMQPGHPEMERLVSASIVAHNKFVRSLASLLEVQTEVFGTKQPTTKVVNYEATTPVPYGVVLPKASDLDRLIGKAGKILTSAPDGGPELPLVTRALGLLAAGRYEDAAALRSTASSRDALVLRYCFDHVVRRANEREPAGHDKNERRGIADLNAYRSALDLRPVAVDTRIHQMARRYSEEQSKQGFFSHEHPNDPARRTAFDRAKAVGYEHGIGENIASDSDAKSAIWGWRADAGHHSVLVEPTARVAGLGCGGTAVLNIGMHCDSPLAALQ